MMALPSSADIKRQILMDSDQTGIRKKMLDLIAEHKMTEGEVIERGVEFERMTTTKGWVFVEQYMLEKMNLTALFFGNAVMKEEWTQTAKAYSLLMAFIDQSIKAKNELIAKESGQTSETEEDSA